MTRCCSAHTTTRPARCRRAPPRLSWSRSLEVGIPEPASRAAAYESPSGRGGCFALGLQRDLRNPLTFAAHLLLAPTHTGSFADRARRSTAAAAASLAPSVADQITIRQAETQTSSHTAGFEAWLRSRGGASGAAAVYTADTIAEQFGVVKDSYTTVPLARPRSVAAAVCKGPGAPLQQVQLITQQLPLELEWGQVGWSRLAANPCNAAAHCPLCMWRVSSTACRLGGWVLAAARTTLGHSRKPDSGGPGGGQPSHTQNCLPPCTHDWRLHDAAACFCCSTLRWARISWAPSRCWWSRMTSARGASGTWPATSRRTGLPAALSVHP